MRILHAAILGVIQGLAEFIPISSSGHLELARRLMGLTESDQVMTLLTVLLHAGTLLAVIVVFWPDWLEVLKKGVNKGSGLYRLADALGVPHDRTFAVGDGYNDADMLRAAKYGFVPANGSEEAKEAGDFIVRSNDEGAVAHVIELLENLL